MGDSSAFYMGIRSVDDSYKFLHISWLMQKKMLLKPEKQNVGRQQLISWFHNDYFSNYKWSFLFFLTTIQSSQY